MQYEIHAITSKDNILITEIRWVILKLLFPLHIKIINWNILKNLTREILE